MTMNKNGKKSWSQKFRESEVCALSTQKQCQIKIQSQKKNKSKSKTYTAYMCVKIDVRTTALQTMNSVQNDLLCIRFRHHSHHSFMLFASTAIRHRLSLSISFHIVTYCCSIAFGTSLQLCAISHINVHVSPFVHRSRGYMCFSILFYLFLYLFGLITNVIFAVGDGNGIARASV